VLRVTNAEKNLLQLIEASADILQTVHYMCLYRSCPVLSVNSITDFNNTHCA